MGTLTSLTTEGLPVEMGLPPRPQARPQQAEQEPLDKPLGTLNSLIGPDLAPEQAQSKEEPGTLQNLMLQEPKQEGIEWTNPLESFVWGVGLKGAGMAASRLLGKQALKVPHPAAKLVGAGLLAIPSFAGFDVASHGLKQTEFGKAHPFLSDLIAGAGIGGLDYAAMKGFMKMPQAMRQQAIDMARKPLQWADQGIRSITEPVGKVWEEKVVDKAKNFLLTPDPQANLLVRGIKAPGAFLAEKFQPAIERLEPKVQETLRKTRAKESLITKTMEEVGIRTAKLNLTDRLDVLKGLRGTRATQLSAEARSVLQDAKQSIKDYDVDPRMVSTFNQQQGRLMSELLKDPGGILNDPAARQALESIDKNIPIGTRFRTMRVKGALADLIASPNSSPALQTLAKELYGLPATIPEQALKAARTASNYQIVRELNQLGTFRLAAEEGYVQSKFDPIRKHFKDLYSQGNGIWVPKDLEMELQSIAQIEKWSNHWFNRIFTSPWKTMKIILSPAAQARNVFTNFILNDIGGLPVWRQDVYGDALRQMCNNSTAWKDFVKTTGGGVTFSRNDLTLLEQAFKYDMPWYEVPGKVLDYMSKYPKSFYNASEQYFKFSKYLHNLEKGMSHNEAAWESLAATFNYGEVTPFVGFLRGTVMPFATWTTKVIPYTFEQALKHPLRVGKWFGLYEGIQNAALGQTGMNEEEYTQFKRQLPQYMQDGLFMMLPWRDERGRLNMLDLTYIVPGLGDIREITSRGLFDLALQQPVASIIADFYHNKKFTGEPITYDWQPIEVQASRMLSHVWDTFLPRLVSPSFLQQSLETLHEVPGSMTTGQYIASLFGAKVKPLEEGQARRQSAAVQQIHQMEMAREMQKELRRATSEEDRAEIIQKYARLRVKYTQERLGLPVVDIGD